MSEEKRAIEDWSVKGCSTSHTKMIVTSAEGADGTVFVSKTENSHFIRVVNMRKDGSKCEFVCSEYDIRAARVAINLFAKEAGWEK